MNKKIFIRSVCFVVFLVSLLFILDLYVSVIAPRNTGIKNYWILSKRNSKYDIAFIGPSRVLHSIDGNVFSEQGKRKVINLGLSGVSYAEQYLILKTFLSENKNTLNELYIEVSYFNFIDPDSSFSYPFHEYYYFPFIEKDYVNAIIQDNSKNSLKALVWRYIPFIRYAEYNSEFRPMVLFRNQYDDVKAKSFDKYGTQFVSGVSDTLSKSFYYKIERMNDKTIGYLNKMIEFAIENGVKVRLFTSPVYFKKVTYCGAAFFNYKKSLKKIVRKYEIKYFDYEEHILSTNIDYFKDYTHLNQSGAMAFSKAFYNDLLNER